MVMKATEMSRRIIRVSPPLFMIGSGHPPRQSKMFQPQPGMCLNNLLHPGKPEVAQPPSVQSLCSRIEQLRLFNSYSVFLDPGYTSLK